MKLRVIGKLKDNKGYIILDEESGYYRAYSKNDLTAALQNGSIKLVNAAICRGQFKVTDSSEERLFEYDADNNMMCTKNKYSLVILDVFTDKNGHKTGYRVCDSNMKIMNMTWVYMDNFIKNYMNKIEVLLINAKVTAMDRGKMKISPIRGQFNTIVAEPEPKKQETKIKNDVEPLENKAKQWRHKKRLEKYEQIPSRLIRGLICKNIKGVPTNWEWVNNKKDINLELECKIFVKEIYTKPEYKLTAKDNELLKKVVKYALENKDATLKVKEDIMGLLSQFLVRRKELADETAKYILRNYSNKIRDYDGNLMTYLMQEKYPGLVGDTIRSYVASIDKLIKERDEKRQRLLEETKYKPFDVVNYNTERAINQIGFTWNKSRDGVKYNTEYGYTKTLKYIGDRQGNEVFGDTYIRYITDQLSSAEPNKVKDIVERNAVFDLETDSRIIIAVMNEIREIALNNGDYELFKIYYESGFNCWYPSDKIIRTAKLDSHLRKDRVINYRQLGNSRAIIDDRMDKLINEVKNGILNYKEFYWIDRDYALRLLNRTVLNLRFV